MFGPIFRIFLPIGNPAKVLNTEYGRRMRLLSNRIGREAAILGNRCQSTQTEDANSRLTSALIGRFNPYDFQIDPPKIYVHVRDAAFRGMPQHKQHQLVLDLVPEDLHEKVIIETSEKPVGIDSEVRKVHVREVTLLPDWENVPVTPQSLLDSAVFHLRQQNGALASEALWLCGSLALRNFALCNRFEPRKYKSKLHIVRFLNENFPAFGEILQPSWEDLKARHEDAYENDCNLAQIRISLKSAELFCNALFDIHSLKTFSTEKFRAGLPKDMPYKDEDEDEENAGEFPAKMTNKKSDKKILFVFK